MAVILYNPKAKNAHSLKSVHRLKAQLLKKGARVTLVDVTQEKDLPSLLKGLPKDTQVILMGGDGSIHHFVNTVYDLLPLPFPIQIVPTGSGNDFYRTLKKSNQDTDLYAMTFANKTEYFVNGMGIGIDGQIGYHVNKDPRKRKSTYLKETFKGLLRYQPETVTVTLDGVKKTFKNAYLVVGSNGQYFGSGMKIAPKASLTDGKLDVVIAHDISKLKILLIFLTIYWGQHLKFKKNVYTQKVSTMTIEFETSKIAQMDGECYDGVFSCDVKKAEKKAAFRIYR
jgi:diacylglycerol kinase family enzyme